MIFIPGNVPSLKNSKVKTSRGIFPSKTVQKYLRSFGIKGFSSSRREVEKYKKIPMTFPVDELKELFKDREYPIVVGLHFIRNSHKAFDFNNASQIVFDLLTAFDLIPDDSMKYVIPFVMSIDDEYYSYNKENPGVYIDVL